MTALAPTLQAFFTDRLTRQKNASPHTIAAYRDTMRLLLVFTEQRTGTPPSRLKIEDLDAPLITAFLDHLEHDRGNCARSRNTRLAAIHSLFGFAALQHPEYAAAIARVLAIPPKRFTRKVVSYLTDAEVQALLAAPDTSRWIGRRDHALLAVAIQTGLRVSELTGLRCKDIQLSTGPHVNCTGKGRKQRCTPLTSQTVATLRAWLRERRGQPDDPLFPHQPRPGTQPRHRRAADHQARRHRRPVLPVAAGKDDHPAHAASHSCDAVAARRRRHLGHRAVARPRENRHRADLPARRPQPERTSPRPHHATRHRPGPLPGTR
jgi:integrase/recombinase XerD